jgi:sporulation protein YlmC with PRC-barrel domain
MNERHLMPNIEDIKSWRGHEARGSEGDKLGEIEDIYLDRETGKPQRMAVRTGLVARHMSFVPLGEARLDGDAVGVPYDQAKGKHAPHADRRIPQQAEADMSDHGPRRAGPAGGSGTRGYGF